MNPRNRGQKCKSRCQNLAVSGSVVHRLNATILRRPLPSYPCGHVLEVHGTVRFASIASSAPIGSSLGYVGPDSMSNKYEYALYALTINGPNAVSSGTGERQSCITMRIGPFNQGCHIVQHCAYVYVERGSYKCLVNVKTGRVDMPDDPFSTIRPLAECNMLCDAVDCADVTLEYKYLELAEVCGSDAIVRLKEVYKEELEVAECDAITCTLRPNSAVDATPNQRNVRFVRHVFFRERVDATINSRIFPLATFFNSAGHRADPSCCREQYRGNMTA